MPEMTVSELKKRLEEADRTTFEILERSLEADTRKGVRNAVEAARRRLDALEAEAARLEGLYRFDIDAGKEHASGCDSPIVLGLDEVGRGPLAGPLTIGGVVLDPDIRIADLNDSKQVKPEVRDRIAAEIKKTARAFTVVHIEPADIDAHGMSASLRKAFVLAIADIERQGVSVDVVLLDGNPLHVDEREVNIVKGDAQSASIAAASILAKVTRDALMVSYDAEYPGYGFAEHKGYGSAAHIETIKSLGLTPIHRKSFCTSFTQETLF